jgi:hypothetical protein
MASGFTCVSADATLIASAKKHKETGTAVELVTRPSLSDPKRFAPTLEEIVPVAFEQEA